MAENKMDLNFDFDNIDMVFEKKRETAILLYAKGEFGEKGELIQRLVAEHLKNIEIDYKNKVFRAVYDGEVFYGIEKGTALEITFYEIIIV